VRHETEGRGCHCEAATDLGFTRDRQPFMRKSGRPDLRARRSNLSRARGVRLLRFARNDIHLKYLHFHSLGSFCHFAKCAIVTLRCERSEPRRSAVADLRIE
jgi:hypothetical protein